MATNTNSVVLTVALVALVLVGLYLIDPTLFGLLGAREGFEGANGGDLSSNANYKDTAGARDVPGAEQAAAERANANNAGGDASTGAGLPGVSGFIGGLAGFMDASGNTDASGNKMGEGFANMEDVSGPADFANAQGPAGCYPRDQLTPAELLPRDANSVWAQQNPMGTGSLKGKNFLSAGALIGVNTVGQSLRNANYQLRSEPPNPQVPVSVFYNSTIEPDVNRRDLEIN
jgi:hypothetical protein